MKKFKDAFCNFLIICFIILGFIASVALMTFIMWLITLTANITFHVVVAVIISVILLAVTLLFVSIGKHSPEVQQHE